jgi:ribosome-binding ATPase YchF (GTP1/OBG family)
VVNIGENQLDEADDLEKQSAPAVSGDAVRVAVLCGQLEMDLAQMDANDEAEFRESLGAGESGLGRMIQLSYDVVGLISFLTVGEDEVRAWEVREGTPAQKAAGKIHTDLERGFIRAEVVPYDDLIECGSLAAARKRGVLRQEGKEYIVKDGDIMHVLFNV